jgi:hypothetical protein
MCNTCSHYICYFGKFHFHKYSISIFSIIIRFFLLDWEYVSRYSDYVTLWKKKQSWFDSRQRQKQFLLS